MKWRRRTAYSIESGTGYFVSKTGPPGSEKYTSWAPGEWYAWTHEPIGIYDTPEEAKEACRNHSSVRQRQR